MRIAWLNSDRKTIQRIAAGTLILVVAAGVIFLWKTGVLSQLASKQQLIHSLRDQGIKGPALLIAAQFLQVVIFIIPGEITQFAAGYVFGVWRGLLYSMIGILLGSAFNFYLARVVGRPTLEALVSASRLERIDRMFANARTKSAMFLLFLLPGAPKDILCYGAGLSRMSLLEFLVVSGLGRLPGLFGSVLFGSRLYHRDFKSLVVIGLVIGIAVLGYYVYERSRGRANRT